MTEIALVLLILGFLFATLQYPALMKRFWKWFLISVGSLVLAIAATVVVVVEREAELKKTTPDPFAHLYPENQVPAKTSGRPWEKYQQPPRYVIESIPGEPTGKGNVFDQFDTPTASTKPVNRQDSLEERVDEALRRAAMPGKN